MTDVIEFIGEEIAYLFGMRPPHYPVPATQHNAQWARHHEWIADCYWWECAQAIHSERSYR